MSNDLEKKADRFNKGKLRWNLVDFESLNPLVQVLEFGATKYSKDNWKKGMPVSEICDSLLRHLIAFMSGEDNDKESNLPHIGHIMCNAMFLSYNQRHNARFDDRPAKALPVKNEVSGVPMPMFDAVRVPCKIVYESDVIYCTSMIGKSKVILKWEVLDVRENGSVTVKMLELLNENFGLWITPEHAVYKEGEVYNFSSGYDFFKVM